MLTIGLTGCRYSGKTSVGKLFNKIGVPVFNADIVLKFIINFKTGVKNSIIANIGEHVYTDGILDPDKFITTSSFDRLIDIVEFDLFQAWERFKDKNRNSLYVIFESSIIFERKYENKFDSIVSVFAAKEDRVYRCKINTGMMVEDIWNLFGKEISELDKNNKSDYVIHNYEDAPDILTQVNSLDKKIVDNIIKYKNRFNDFEEIIL
jgi:dephospho-CoA kinase